MPESRYHFSGIAGAGMFPLARLLAGRGHRVQGSDRSFDQGHNATVQELLRADGIELHPQDGSAITADIDQLVHSTAVERTTPELARADELGIRTVPRPELLAQLIAAGEPGVAVAGTSGKSTLVGMVAWILRRCDMPATVLGGAALAEGGATHMGCFQSAGAEAPVIAEACESDGTLIGYHPGLAVIHNITRDHDELEAVTNQFRTFALQSERLLFNAACPVSVAIAAEHPHAQSYGASGDIELDVVQTGPWRGQGTIIAGDREAMLDLPQPGRHNLDNATAAVAVAISLGLDLQTACRALDDFPGVARRYQVLGTTEDGIRVIDDFAHNADKLRAAIRTAQEGCDRLVAVFQPHGFGPARFLRPELKTLLAELLRPQDRFCYAGIYFAGGTVAQDISSADLAADQPPQLRIAHAETHVDVLDWVSATANPGDTVLVMGARDPQLPALARALFDLL